jgi:hypothetical protein
MSRSAEQTVPQLMAAGLLVTVPVPDPDFSTSRGKVKRLNMAVTVVAAFMVTTQVPVPEQGPFHPAKTVFVPSTAVSVTTVPKG